MSAHLTFTHRHCGLPGQPLFPEKRCQPTHPVLRTQPGATASQELRKGQLLGTMPVLTGQWLSLTSVSVNVHELTRVPLISCSQLGDLRHQVRAQSSRAGHQPLGGWLRTFPKLGAVLTYVQTIPLDIKMKVTRILIIQMLILKEVIISFLTAR